MQKHKFTNHIPVAKRLVLVEHIFSLLADHLHLCKVTEHLRGYGQWEEAFPGTDYEDVAAHLLENLEQNYISTFFEKALPELIQDQLGASKVSITWLKDAEEVSDEQ